MVRDAVPALRLIAYERVSTARHGGQRARAEVNGAVALCLRLDQGTQSLAF
jgi:hypothetical protein